MTKTILSFRLEMPGEPIAQRKVNPVHVVAPRFTGSARWGNTSKKLLVPPSGGIKPGGDLVLGFEIVAHQISVAHIGDLEPRKKYFAPQLPSMPRITYIVIQRDLVIIADTFASRQLFGCIMGKIRANTEGNTVIPGRAGTETQASANGRIPPQGSIQFPGVGVRRDRGVFKVKCVIKSIKCSKDSPTGGINRSPDDRQPQVLHIRKPASGQKTGY